MPPVRRRPVLPLLSFLALAHACGAPPPSELERLADDAVEDLREDRDGNLGTTREEFVAWLELRLEDMRAIHAALEEVEPTHPVDPATVHRLEEELADLSRETLAVKRAEGELADWPARRRTLTERSRRLEDELIATW